MKRHFFGLANALPVVAGCAILSALAGTLAWSQTASAVASQPAAVKTRLPIGYESTGRKQTLEFRAEAQMTAQDRALVESARASIRDRAGFYDLGLNEGAWSDQQAVCPALPNHLLLQFTRNQGVDDESVFSVVIPRSGAGRVRVLPVERRGFSLFRTAPMNAVTIAFFNQIRAEEQMTEPIDWLTLGLCYATLAGVHPKAELQAETPETEKFPEAMPATLVIEKNNTEQIRFVDATARPKPMYWSMKFDQTGKLVKATHKPAKMLKEKPTKQTLVEVGGYQYKHE